MLRAPASIIRYFSPARVPLMLRQSYRQELIATSTVPAAQALIEGGVAGILAAKTFNIDVEASFVDQFLFATIMASPMFANLTSFYWARMSRGKPKVRLINLLQVALIVTVGAIALLPRNPLGAYLLTALVVLSRCVLAGIVTMRSVVWRNNYPRHLRAQVTGKLALIASLIMATVPLVGYAMLDWRAESFRIVYPLGMLIAVPGVIAYSRIRLRGEREQLTYEQRSDAKPTPHGAPDGIYEYDPQSPRHSFWSVLRNDPLFRQYMLWQFFGGSGFMMTNVVVVEVVNELTEGMRWEYVIAILLTTTIPKVLGPATLAVWAKYLDRVHIIRFRVTQSYFWLVLQSLTWLGAATGSLGILAGAQAVSGVSQGGGVLAWNLGHNDFADRRLVAVYMGIHQMLAGVRGIFMPYLGTLLYTNVLGRHTFAVGLAMSFIAFAGMQFMLRSVGPAAVAPSPD